MSKFNTMLSARGLSIHSGQALWKYNLTDIEFENLKKSFRFIDKPSQLKPKDCALYYAEWWRRCYDGGKPSKEIIYNSLQVYDNQFSIDDFYNYAKLGGELLGYKWIKNRYTFYFKTLLLQGGLPLLQIKNNEGRYRNFLEEILKMNPLSIEEFNNQINVTSLLPLSSQNDIVYESCLQIVRAINNGDENSILVYTNNDDLNRLTTSLVNKRNQTKIRKQKIKFQYYLDIENQQIFINSTLPITISSSDLKSFLNDDSTELTNEYNLFFNDDFVAKFIRKNDNNYSINSYRTFLNITDEIRPQIKMFDINETEYSLQHLLPNFIEIDKPTLWNKINEKEFVLEHSRNTSSDQGCLLVPFDFETENSFELLKEINFAGNNLKIIQFEGEIEFIRGNENYIFKTNTPKTFDWNIISDNPKWIHKTNIPIIQDRIKINAYDLNNNPINNLLIEFKLTNGREWTIYNPNVFLPIGALDVKLTYHDNVEFDKVYNIKDFNVNLGLDVLNPSLTFDNKYDLNIEVYESELYSSDINVNSVDFKLLNNHKLPSSIQIRIFKENQVKGAILKIVSPFQGVNIVDDNDKLIENNTIYADYIRGYRLITNVIDKEIEVVLFNKLNKELKITRPVLKSTTSLQSYQSHFQQLFKLHNITDKNNIVCINIVEVQKNENRRVLKSFEVKQFSVNLTYTLSTLQAENEFLFDLNDKIEVEDLFAIPLDCEINNIDLIPLEKENGFFRLNNIINDKYILFSKDSANYKIKPEFLSINPNNQLTDLNDRIDRIKTFKDELLNANFSDEIWQKYLVYYYLCKENNLPFSTFDILKSTSTSSKLAAKAFCFLVKNFDGEQNNFSGNDFLDFQNDIGFSFNWVSVEDWSTNIIYYEAIARMQNIMHTNFILNPIPNNNFVLNQEFTNVRQRLGVRVISELPSFQLDYIPNQYHNSIANVDNNNNLNLLASYPLLITLSILNLHDYIWHPKGENTRKRILYLMDLDTDWYKNAIKHYTTTLN
ncbi:hypothetical protein OBK01_03505 [Empedobacter falsenii]